jgi:hypothetical protein
MVTKQTLALCAGNGAAAAYNPRLPLNLGRLVPGVVQGVVQGVKKEGVKTDVPMGVF